MKTSTAARVPITLRVTFVPCPVAQMLRSDIGPNAKLAIAERRKELKEKKQRLADEEARARKRLFDVGEEVSPPPTRRTPSPHHSSNPNSSVIRCTP